MTTGVLLMAYGAPASMDEVGAFFTHIRHGRRPPEDRIEELRHRYSLIGGGASLRTITSAQARSLEAALTAKGKPLPVFLGYRHAAPFVEEAVREAVASGLRRLVALPLAPHESSLSTGAYMEALRKAAGETSPRPVIVPVGSWHAEPGFIGALASALRETLERARAGGPEPLVIFTAHSLPERILAAGEPYRDQLLETARLVAGRAGLGRYEFAFQSASPTGEPWLGPDILETLKRLAGAGCRRVVIQPVGFLADHLEILYDVDILCRKTGEDLGVEVMRTPSMNTREGFISALATIVERAIEAAGPATGSSS